MRSKSASHRSVRGFADPQSFGSLDTHISTLDSRARENLLREAAARGDVASVTLLVARGVDMNAADPAGWSALHSAADGGHEQVVQELLNAGAKTDNQNEDSLTALDLSIVQGFLQVAQIILASDLDARPHRGNTHTQTRSALYFAVDRGKAELVKALLQAGAVISEVNSTTGDTMLHMAALQGSAEVVCMLLNAGLDPKARNKAGLTSIDIARRSRDPRLMAILKR